MVFNDILFEIQLFSQLISRLNALCSPTQVFVTHSAENVSVYLFQEGETSNASCLLRTSCRRLDWQLFFATRISSQLAPLLSRVRYLVIHKDHKLSAVEEDVDSTQWLELFQPFTHVTQVHISEMQIVPGIVQALGVRDMGTRVDLASPERVSQFPICGRSC
jgi:hypothetical protein